jgi:hypothetical protein
LIVTKVQPAEISLLFQLETDLITAHCDKISGGITERACRFRLQDLGHGQNPEGPTNHDLSVNPNCHDPVKHTMARPAEP